MHCFVIGDPRGRGVISANSSEFSKTPKQLIKNVLKNSEITGRAKFNPFFLAVRL